MFTANQQVVELPAVIDQNNYTIFSIPQVMSLLIQMNGIIIRYTCFSLLIIGSR